MQSINTIINHIINSSFLQTFFYLVTKTNHSLFWMCAIFGSTLFVLRCITAIGGFSDESDSDNDMDSDHSDHQISLFKLFTLHSLSGFFMMFGWTGLTCLEEFHYNYSTTLVVASCVGFLTVILTSLIFKWAQSLINTGSHFSIEKTIGMIGTVYQQIPSHGQGKIHLIVDGVTREILAQSYDNSPIPSFCIIQVISVVDYETVLVKKHITL